MLFSQLVARLSGGDTPIALRGGDITQYIGDTGATFERDGMLRYYIKANALVEVSRCELSAYEYEGNIGALVDIIEYEEDSETFTVTYVSGDTETFDLDEHFYLRISIVKPVVVLT